jgi:hypothetical protein
MYLRTLAAVVSLLMSARVLKTTPQDGHILTADDCTSVRLGSAIPVASIGEPVAGVTLAAPRWVAEAGNAPAYCSIDGAMAPTDTSSHGRPINFRVVLPASWTSHAVQLGGGGMNGSIPNLTAGEAATLLQRGFATYGSDSGHQQAGFGPRRGGPAPAAGPSGDDWALSDEAIKNLGYMQLKKTHDAAMVLIERAYGERPRFNYFVGTSQGGREALTVAQRYPNDYNGIAANVPIVSFSSLMLGPELIRIQEKPLANWVTPAKVEAIRAEFVRQCDKLDGLADGIINNYMACRAIFDMSQGNPNRNPWASKRCPDNVDPNPADTTANACFTDGQISTAEGCLQPLQIRDASGKRNDDLRHVGSQYRSFGQRAHHERPLQRSGRRHGGRTEPFASWRSRCDRIFDEGHPRESSGLRRRRSVECAPCRDLRLARLDQPRSVSLCETWRENDRRHQH